MGLVQGKVKTTSNISKMRYGNKMRNGIIARIFIFISSTFKPIPTLTLLIHVMIFLYILP